VTPSSANTSNDMLNDLSVDVQTSATSGTGVGVVPLASLPDATEENSAVIAGHGNATKHICKTCYDRYAWTVFRQIDDLWSAYWAGVKKSQPAVSSTPVDTSRLHWRAPK
jgi:hypothetical protein